MTQESLKRMKSLVHIKELNNLQRAVLALAADLDDEGFDMEDIKLFLLSQVEEITG